MGMTKDVIVLPATEHQRLQLSGRVGERVYVRMHV